MRKITKQAIEAFLGQLPFRSGNTTVEIRPWQNESFDSVILLLHGNPIARYVRTSRAGPGGGYSQTLMVCDGGWQTATTKDRLNGIPGVSVHQKAGQWYLNGEPWAGYWIRVHSGYLVREIHHGDGTSQWRVDHPKSTGLASLWFDDEHTARIYVAVQTGQVDSGLAA